MSINYNRYKKLASTKIPLCVNAPNTLFAITTAIRDEDLGHHVRSEYNIRALWEKVTNDIAELDKSGSVLVGIEVELEHARTSDRIIPDKYLPHALVGDMLWIGKADGSLRNNGVEFVTRYGVKDSHVKLATESLEGLIKIQYPDSEANGRTGLHVHINVSQLTANQLANFLFLYAILEPFFFHVSGNRAENLYCVPWERNHQKLSTVIDQLLMGNMARWRNYSKYCALNVACIETFGTVEFRMHEGTYDAVTIQKWVASIVNLYNLAQKSDFIESVEKFRTQRTSYKYWDLVYQVFPDYLPDIVRLSVNEKDELMARCKYSTVVFLKGFVDRNNMPDVQHMLTSKKVVNKPKKSSFTREIRFDEEAIAEDEARFNEDRIELIRNRILNYYAGAEPREEPANIAREWQFNNFNIAPIYAAEAAPNFVMEENPNREEEF